MQKENILVIGAGGQIGSVLTASLRDVYGHDYVLATDIRPLDHQTGPSMVLDVMQPAQLAEIVQKNKITQIYHLAAILSATGEKDPQKAWSINMGSLFNVLEVSRSEKVQKVYFPSSIAVFGKEAAPQHTPQHEVLIPETVYGISKAAGENWANYYVKRYGMDIRSIRYPGIIGYQSLPGGGTTDYAVDIYHYAVKKQAFTCFLKENTRLPMMYMADAIRGTLELMDAPAEALTVRTSYNLAGMSFTPKEIFESIKKLMPNFQMTCEPDFRQAIAESWPESIDDSAARADWGWKPHYDLDSMTADMLFHLEVVA